MLQDRLDHVIKHLNDVVTHNRDLRIDIDHLLKERGRFNVIWENLLKNVAAGKKTMIDLIEHATLAFDQREEWCLKVLALEKKAQNDLLVHSEEMREIQRKLDNDLILREFLIVKGQKRVLKDLEEKEKQKRELEVQSLEDQLTVYQKTLEKIQEFCKENETERITSFFLKQEEENFALFNYVNELNHEIELLNNNIKLMEEQLDKQLKSNELKSKEADCTIKTFQDTLDTIVEKANFEETLMKKCEFELRTVLNGIKKIFKILVCDEAPILELLNETSAVNIHNVKVYLETIEKKVSDLMNKLFFSEKET